MRFLGETTEGVYTDDPMNDIHPDIINRYYGVDGPERLRNSMHTGAGIVENEDEAPDEDEASTFLDADLGAEEAEEYLENMIAEDQEHNIRHAPVPVARHRNPFETDEEEAEFFSLLGAVANGNIVPAGYGVLQEEWDEDNYPEREIINVGARAVELEVTLTREVWLPRAICWAQGLDVMERLIIEREDTQEGSSSDTSS